MLRQPILIVSFTIIIIRGPSPNCEGNLLLLFVLLLYYKGGQAQSARQPIVIVGFIIRQHLISSIFTFQEKIQRRNTSRFEDY